MTLEAAGIPHAPPRVFILPKAHPNLGEFAAEYGGRLGTIEERPGIPPSPAHLARLVRLMKDEQVRLVVAEPWSDQRLTARVAHEAGASVVVLNARLGQVSGPDAYIASTWANVSALAEALRR